MTKPDNRAMLETLVHGLTQQWLMREHDYHTKLDELAALVADEIMRCFTVKRHEQASV